MTWVKTADRLPPENEQVLVHDGRSNKTEVGRFVEGRWYVEDGAGGRLREVAGVTHWCWILESYLNDESEDD
ncbi:MAG TPA: hypothetical protein VGV38_20615 [Pyrinomonadaceae bacterium]|nr:hypothetical protein [Pyrinomonadaceae bacterium]